MPKRCIALLLLITMTLGPAAGAFASVMDKIRGIQMKKYAACIIKHYGSPVTLMQLRNMPQPLRIVPQTLWGKMLFLPLVWSEPIM
jgi:hypothetical protein